jgi:hypothetical protein
LIGLAVNIARLVGNIFIYNNTQSDNLEYIGRLAFAMKRQVEEEDIHTTHTAPYEAKDAYVLGRWVKMQMQNASTAARI